MTVRLPLRALVLYAVLATWSIAGSAQRAVRLRLRGAVVTRLRVAAAGLLIAGAIGCGARSRILPLSDTMYDWDLPPVVAAPPLPSQCPSLPAARRVRPPDVDTPSIVECIDHYAPIAADVLRQFESSPDASVRRACEDILARLWQRRLLSHSIKHRIVDRHVRLTLAQSMAHLPRLDLTVETATSFSLPMVVFTVRALIYHSGSRLASSMGFVPRSSLRRV